MSKKTIADLRAMHDKNVVVPNRIKQALEALAKSGDAWAYEADFLNLAKPRLGTIDLAKYRDQFTDFWAEMPKSNTRGHVFRVWFATKKAADEWKDLANG